MSANLPWKSMRGWLVSAALHNDCCADRLDRGARKASWSESRLPGQVILLGPKSLVTLRFDSFPPNMYTCIHAYMHTCIHVYMYAHTYICVLFVCMYTYIYPSPHMCICIHVYMYMLYMCICIYVYMYICIHVYMYTTLSEYVCFEFKSNWSMQCVAIWIFIYVYVCIGKGSSTMLYLPVSFVVHLYISCVCVFQFVACVSVCYCVSRCNVVYCVAMFRAGVGVAWGKVCQKVKHQKLKSAMQHIATHCNASQRNATRCSSVGWTRPIQYFWVKHESIRNPNVK